MFGIKRMNAENVYAEERAQFGFCLYSSTGRPAPHIFKNQMAREELGI